MKFLTILAFCALAPLGKAALVTFDDGSLGAAVGAAYSAQGVTFANTQYVSAASVAGTSAPFAIVPISDNDGDGFLYTYSVTDAMSATFLLPQTQVSFTASDLGQAGIRIDAYDAEVGGLLISFTELFGAGTGVGNSQTITVSGAGIRRVEIYQPNFGDVDGVVVDNFEFSADAVPEPSSLWLLGSGIAAVGFRFRRNRG